MNTGGILGHNGQLQKLSAMHASGSIPQAMIFSGVSGIGKKLAALRFLNALFCGERTKPCLQCPVCLLFRKGAVA